MGNVSSMVIDARLKALANFRIEKLIGDVYIVQGVATYYVATDYWSFADGSARGYTQRSMIAAIDDAQLRGMIPEVATATPPSPKLGPVLEIKTEPTPVAGRDNAHGASDPDRAVELTQPLSVESATGPHSTPGLPKVDWG